MKRRESVSAVGILVRAVILMVLTAGAVWWLLVGGVARGPSVLVITLDSLRADALSLYGYHRLTSPNLDAFAERCYVFDQAFSQHYYTGPGHASILTSRYPRSHGIFRNALVLDDRHLTLGEHFRARGYRTGAIVNVSLLSEEFNYQQGFQFFRYVKDYPEDGEDRNIIAQALDWILAPGQRRRPFFFWMHLNYTHSWYDPPVPFARAFQDAPTPSRQMLSYYDVRQAYEDGDLMAEEIAWARNRYDGEILYTDDWLGGLFKRLGAEGLLDRTIVVVTADHGEAFNLAQGRFGHARHLHDEVTRIPLLVYVPSDLTAMRRIGAMVQQMDLAPTLVALTAGKMPDAFQGRSLLPLMRGEVEALHEALILGVGREWHPVAIRTLRWKLIQHQEDPPELYDLAQDPGETVNVYAQFPEEARALEAALEVWRHRTPETVGQEPEERTTSPQVETLLREAGYLEEAEEAGRR